MRVETLTAKILSLMPKVGKCQYKFLLHFFSLLISFRGRANFINLARQGEYNESSYRNNYDKDFDFLAFNKQLIKSSCEGEMVIAFDPSFISKSGKSTDGLGYFWSGGANRKKVGLEIGAFGAVDILNNTCMHLTAKQTVNQQQHGSLLKYYAHTVGVHSEALKSVSKYLAVDAFFSKHTFVEPVCQMGFEVISRLRDDAALFYRYLGSSRKKGSGRQKVYQGRVDVKQLDEQHFTTILKESNWTAYQAVVFSRALKKWIKVVVVHQFKPNGELKNAKIYFSTDLTLEGTDILLYYKARFQIEFLYRDAKQFTGLQHCQSRKEKRLDFHFNAALTAVSIAKAAHYLNIPFEQRKSFSMASIKTQYFNELLLNKFFSTFGLDPNVKKIKAKFLSLREFGKIAA